MDKPVSEEYKHPEWIWYGESTNGPVISLGRWAKYPSQRRYKIAEIQATEHDHPSICVKDKPANRFYGEQRAEIKPGSYGAIDFGGFWNRKANLDCQGFMTADELREAAHLFVQLAEYLDNNN